MTLFKASIPLPLQLYGVIFVTYLLLAQSEQCNIGLGNLGFGNIGVGNWGIGNRGVLNGGIANVGVFNQLASRTIGVGNVGSNGKIGVGSVITVPNFFPKGKKK